MDAKNDRFVGQGEGYDIPSCGTCKHAIAGTNTCAAFPKDIPLEISIGRDPHTSPYEGDNGIQYEPEV